MAKIIQSSNTFSHLTQPKVGVFYNKDQKLINLEKTNANLKEQLEDAMKSFESISKNHQEVKLQIGKLENQNNFLELEKMMFSQSISKMAAKVKEWNPELTLRQLEISSLAGQIQILQQQLRVALAKAEDQANLIKRYHQEIKMQKMMLKSQKNLTKVCETYKKSYQNYLKNIEILSNKLQSKKKYLSILQKKLLKQTKDQQEKMKFQTHEKVQSLKTFNSFKQLPSKHNLKRKKQETDQNQQAKANLKSYNELIRKKNAILAKKK